MKVNTLPLLVGKTWLINAFTMLRQNFALYCAISCLHILSISFIVFLIPYLGVAIGNAITFLFAAFFIFLTHTLYEKQPFLPAALFKSITNNKQLLLLSIGYTIAALLLWEVLNLIYALIIPDLLTQVQDITQRISQSSTSITQADAEIFQNYLLLTQLSGAVIYGVLFLFFGLAPALCHWHQFSAGKAVFCSIMATSKNLLSFIIFFLLYVLTIIAIILVLSIVAAFLATLMGSLVVIPLVALSIFIILAANALLQIAIYFAYKDTYIFD